MRRLTVVQLLPALASGGVERSTLEIAEALARAGHRAIVVSAGGRLVPTLEKFGGEHVALG
ncbi:MAG: glycosyl transferase, partial [Pseudomonadota bacterium]|nr:glycosyl transferase [Pseudomonadota bacterium]